MAYADFVTAMMAFFLLLWLLSTSSKATLEGIAEYFTPTTGVRDGLGIGFKGGAADALQGIQKSDMGEPGVVTGTTQMGVSPENPEKQAPTPAEEEDNLFAQGATAITQAFSREKALQPYQENIRVQETPEGLKIDIMDSDKYGMFEPASATLTEHGQLILGKMAMILKRMPTYMAIDGHTDASPLETGQGDYTNWELSSDRAQSARRYLVKTGMEPERPKRVTGLADKQLLAPNEPRNPRNRRITLTMLRGSHILIPDAAVPEMAKPSAPVPAPVPTKAVAPAADAATH